MKLKLHDYRGIRFNNLTNPQYKHLLLVLYWPIYGILFALEEALIKADHPNMHFLEHPLDDKILFNEWYFIPYFLWYIMVFGNVFFAMAFDAKLLKKYMWYVIIAYSVTLLIYAVYPNGQQLRVYDPPRDNILTDCVQMIYSNDTNTNVCPSLHVVGAIGVMFALLHSEYFKKWFLKIILIVTTYFVCVSTVYMKQHSIIDLWVGVALGFVVYLIIWHTKPFKRIDDPQYIFPGFKKQS